MIFITKHSPHRKDSQRFFAKSAGLWAEIIGSFYKDFKQRFVFYFRLMIKLRGSLLKTLRCWQLDSNDDALRI